jgi:aldehyde:ferredoxin oxidoreductase
MDWNGYGRLLHVDLTTGVVEPGEIPPEWTIDFLGGSGMGARLLWDYLRPEIAPLDPRSPLLFITGPLTGSAGPTTGRFTVCGRSPQTGWWAESNIGGFVGPELRFAGWDALLLTGKAAQPVYLWIHNQQVELRSADHLLGGDMYATQAAIRAETGQPQARVASIGLAGERGVRFSGIFSDHGRAAARTGLGAVMGSKNLKAVAVRGTNKLVFARDAEYRRLRVAANKDLIEQNMTAVLKATGTAGAADYLQMLGDMPQRYWTAPTFDGAGSVGGAEMAEKYLTAATACQGCVIACGREVEVTEGSYSTGGKRKGPEYETICAFGPQLMVDDLPAITALGDRCDRYGMDSITAGSVIGLAYLLYNRGLLSEADTDGLALRWGDPAPAFALLDKIAWREGIGAWMAEGARAFAARFGVEELAVQINGMEVAMHDPRAFSGMALVYATSPRGACHNQSDFFTVEMGAALDDIGIPMPDRFSDAGKAALVARHQHWRTVCNDLVMCFFAVVPPGAVLELVNAALDVTWTMEELLQAGERGWNLKRLINLRLGYTPAGEKLPALLRMPLPEGGQAGYQPDLDAMLDEYYAACGWDRSTGRPLPETLRRLGLDCLAGQGV